MRPRKRRKQTKPVKAQMKVILDYMGVSMIDQPTSTKEVNALVEKARLVDPKKYDEAYSIVVNHVLPEELTNDATAINFKEIGELIKDHIIDCENKAVLNIENESIKLVEGMAKEIHATALKSISEAASKYVRIEVKVGNKKPVKLEDDILPECFPSLLQLAQERVNVLMVGPSGCGKTHVAYLIAKALGLPFGSQSCSAGVSESVFTGWLLPTGTGAKFTHVMSEFLTRYEKGGVFLLDELDASDPNVLVFINQALGNESFMVPQRYENPLFVKHKDFVALAAANTYGLGADSMYHGRNSLDAATLDRFRMGTVSMDYSDAVESSIIDPEVLTWGRLVRRTIANHSLQKIMSTRVMKDATRMRQNQGWTIKQISDTYSSDWSKEEKRILSSSVGY